MNGLWKTCFCAYGLVSVKARGKLLRILKTVFRRLSIQIKDKLYFKQSVFRLLCFI